MKKKVLFSILAIIALLAINALAFSTVASAKRQVQAEEICAQSMGRCVGGGIGLLCDGNTGGWTCRHRDCGGC